MACLERQACVAFELSGRVGGEMCLMMAESEFSVAQKKSAWRGRGGLGDLFSALELDLLKHVGRGCLRAQICDGGIECLYVCLFAAQTAH